MCASFTVSAFAGVPFSLSPGSRPGFAAAAESLGWDRCLCGASRQPRPPAVSGPQQSSGRPALVWQIGSRPSDSGRVPFLGQRYHLLSSAPHMKNNAQYHGERLASRCQCSSEVSCCWVEEWTEDELNCIIGLNPIIIHVHVPVETRASVHMETAFGWRGGGSVSSI